MSKTIYITVSHINFWWGVHGFCPKTSWEDIEIYDKTESEYKRIAWTRICTKTFLEDRLEALVNDTEAEDFAQQVREFLAGRETIYQCYYDERNDVDFYEVPFNAPTNEHGIKPRYIETWYSVEGIGLEEIEPCIREFCGEILGIDIERVEVLDAYEREGALEWYVEEMEALEKGDINPRSTELFTYNW